MDARLREIVLQKMTDMIKDAGEFGDLIGLFGELAVHRESFARGVAVGRLYNSFYYQCRRILKRGPTEEEFGEFLILLKEHERDLARMV